MGRIIDSFYITGRQHLDEKYFHESFESLLALPLAERPLGQMFYVKSDRNRDGKSSLYILRDGITNNDFKLLDVDSVTWDNIEGKPDDLIDRQKLNEALENIGGNLDTIIYKNSRPTKFTIGGIPSGTTFEDGISLNNLITQIFYGIPEEVEPWKIYMGTQYVKKEDNSIAWDYDILMYGENTQNKEIEDVPFYKFKYEVKPLVTKFNSSDLPLPEGKVTYDFKQTVAIAVPIEFEATFYDYDGNNIDYELHQIQTTLFNRIDEPKQYNIFYGKTENSENVFQGAMDIDKFKDDEYWYNFISGYKMGAITVEIKLK